MCLYVVVGCLGRWGGGGGGGVGYGVEGLLPTLEEEDTLRGGK